MGFRIESDTMGPVEVADGRYWGAQTERALRNFRIGDQRFGRAMIKAFGIVKKAAAIENGRLGKLSAEKVALVVQAADEVIDGTLDDHFPLVVWQTGSGTQSNMNANEVIANRAIELAGGALGSKEPVHPNDDVNMSQSSNDVFPTVMHVAAVMEIEGRLLPALRTLTAAVTRKSEAFADIVKVGRTHLMDATPLTLGQEVSGWARGLELAETRIAEAVVPLHELALGGTAVGTGLNTHPAWASEVAGEIALLSGHPFVTAKNKFAALAAHDAIVGASAACRGLAIVLLRMANDVRLLASGPRCGLGELLLPENEPGSSIMPGKVNPTQAEALSMVCAHVIGNDAAVSFAGAGGYLELSVFKPVMIHDLLESVGLLSDGMVSFEARCVAGMEPDRAAIARHVESSLMLVTALNETIGYEAGARIVAHARAEGVTLRQAAVALGVLTAEEFDARVRPDRMLGPEDASAGSGRRAL